ncbi:MAG TPA: hypothetical protein VE243_05420 [Candidatus Acidoferrum sp.]|nr:hypothetical protein [Candidatus Acidoferrum sp.]
MAHAELDFGEIELLTDRVQIIHNGVGSDVTNFNITFTSFGEGDCDGGFDDAIASGIEVALNPDTCPSQCAGDAPCAAPLTSFPFDYDLEPFVPHTVNHQTYGTFFGLNPFGVGPGTVSARIVLMSQPVNGCGTWQLNVEATGLDLSSITSNPMSLWLNDADFSGPFCFDINNAIIGAPINPHRPVHRRVRRQ